MALKSVLMTTFIGYTWGEDDAEGAASHTDASRKNGVQYIPVNKKMLSELH